LLCHLGSAILVVELILIGFVAKVILGEQSHQADESSCLSLTLTPTVASIHDRSKGLGNLVLMLGNRRSV
jgi:hypothetical protein